MCELIAWKDVQRLKCMSHLHSIVNIWLEESWSHLCDHGCMMRDAIAEVKCWIFCEGASFATPRSLELRSWGDPIHIKNQTVADSHCFSHGVNSAKRQQDVWILLILQYLYIYYDVLGLYSSSLWRFHRVPCSSFTEIWSFGAIPSTRFWTFAVDVIQDKPRPPVQKPLRRPGHASSVTESSLDAWNFSHKILSSHVNESES